MLRTGFRVLVLGLAGLSSPAFAAGIADQIAAKLRGQGFDAVQVERTLLGRERITGVRGGGSREIIVNPNTGEVLRDLWLNAEGEVTGSGILSDDQDDDDDDDDDGDNSGSGKGGGNKGSGNSGSGSGDDD